MAGVSRGMGRRGRSIRFNGQSALQRRLLSAVQPSPDNGDDNNPSGMSSRGSALASTPNQRPPAPVVSSRRNINGRQAASSHPTRRPVAVDLAATSASGAPPLHVNTTNNLPGTFPSSTTPHPPAMPHQPTDFEAILNQVQQYMTEARSAARNTFRSFAQGAQAGMQSTSQANPSASSLGVAPLQQSGVPLGFDQFNHSSYSSNAPSPFSGAGGPSWAAGAAPSLQSLGFTSFLPRNYFNSALSGDTSDIVGDDDMLMSVLDPNYEDDNEPVDADMQDILNNMVDGTYNGSDALASLYGDKGIDVGKLSLYSDTESLQRRGLKTPLHAHQLQGLLWMIKAEHRRVSKTEGTLRGLWQTRKDGRGKAYYFNVASRKAKRIAPVLPRGGINSDSMGLGKTIQSEFEHRHRRLVLRR